MSVLTEENIFDPNLFLDQLIDEMGFKNASPEKVSILKDNLANRLHDQIFAAASQNVEPEIVEQAIEKYGDEKDLWQFILKLLQMSPAAKKAITEAIDEFRDQTLAAYEIMAEKG